MLSRKRKSRRQRHDPAGRHASVFCEPAPGVLTHVVTGDEHFVAGAKFGTRLSTTAPASVDARNVRILAGHARIAGGGQGVLIVER